MENNSEKSLKDLDTCIAEKIYGILPFATSDAEIGAAVFSALRSTYPVADRNLIRQLYIWNQKEYEVSCEGSKLNYGKALGNDGYGLWFWHNRFGKDWQSDIEEHVKNWRKPSDPYSSYENLAFAVAEKVGLLKNFVLIKESVNKWTVLSRDGVSLASLNASTAKVESVNLGTLKPLASGKTVAEAICRASLVVVFQKSEAEQRRMQECCRGF
jgi:hypothetical protein